MNIILLVFTALLLIFTLLSLIRYDNWVFRVFDYPRLQKLVATTVILVLNILLFEGGAIFYWIINLLLFANTVYLTVQILPFTILGKKQVLKAVNDLPDQSVCIMIANVYQDNHNIAGCLHEIYKNNPDVVLLLETNKRWDEDTTELIRKYPHQIKVPLENTYGMLLYSKIELLDGEVKYLVEEHIPSIHVTLILKSGQQFRLFAVHPTPPVPQENPRSTERDKELLMVAELVSSSPIPAIVIGDLNDVAWSYTTTLFLKMSGMIDPRRGRGFFNSFHAHYPFLRFPLDHAFLSTDFKLKKMKRLSNFGSDHFPIYIWVQYEHTAQKQQESMEVDVKDVLVAEEKKQAI